jgi:hypothetical protein
VTPRESMATARVALGGVVLALAGLGVALTGERGSMRVEAGIAFSAFVALVVALFLRGRE